MSTRTIQRILDALFGVIAFQFLFTFGGFEALAVGILLSAWNFFDGWHRSRWSKTPEESLLLSWRTTPLSKDKYGIGLCKRKVVDRVTYTQELIGFNFRNSNKLWDTDFDRYIEKKREELRKENLKDAQSGTVSDSNP